MANTAKAYDASIFELPELSDGHFKFLADLAYRQIGIHLHVSKKSLVKSRLGKRLRLHGMSRWEDYIKLLQQDDPLEIASFINQITTNKTEFFRESKHFDFIANTVLPKLTKQPGNIPTFWIGASSYGHEAYSLSMTIREFQTAHGSNFPYRILSTDIDSDALGVGETGIYREDIVKRQVPQRLQSKYFLRGSGKNQSFMKVQSVIREPIKFRLHNLCNFDESIPLKFDVILLRNVLIYFDRETIDRVVAKAIRHLKPGGYLIVGHCESFLEPKSGLTSVGQAIYQYGTKP